eukprot:4056142-Pleurochrysis_carterae.AAC.2
MLCVTSTSIAIAGSLRENITLIVTLCQRHHGDRPKYGCSVDLPLRTSKGSTEHMRLDNVLVVDNALHNLVSLGRLAKQAYIGVYVEATSGSATLTLPSGATVPLVTAGVLIDVPTVSASTIALPAVVTHGKRELAKGGRMAAVLLHSRFNH